MQKIMQLMQCKTVFNRPISSEYLMHTLARCLMAKPAIECTL